MVVKNCIVMALSAMQTSMSKQQQQIFKVHGLISPLSVAIAPRTNRIGQQNSRQVYFASPRWRTMGKSLTSYTINLEIDY